MIKTIEQKRNCIISDLRNLVSEFKNETLNVEDIYNYVSTMLIDSGMDSRDVVKILEEMYDDESKSQILGIKINEGW